mmetsp:Transcript_43027/g.41391  ORF Transcript_43027/g.41391 Transcript_43027/m.41391 type:complete len:118 (+) Transcript_43027:1287-1640(+)
MPIGICIWYLRGDRINTFLQKLLLTLSFFCFAFPLYAFFNNYVKITRALRNTIIYSYYTTLLVQYLFILGFSITTFMINDEDGSAGLRKAAKSLVGFLLSYSTIMLFIAIGYHVVLY